MPYCEYCGAYIPEGQSVCLACGKNSDEKTNSANAAYEYAPKQNSSEDLKRKLEEQRKKQQEDSRRWAEAEYKQRQKQKEQQSNFYGSSASEKKRTERANNSGLGISMTKLLAAGSYLSVLFVLPYLFARKDNFAMFHAKQGLCLFIAGIAAEIICSFIGISWIATLLRIYFIYLGMKNAVNDKYEKLPYIGNIIK